MNSVELVRGTCLLDAYGSAEIEDIAQESLADSGARAKLAASPGSQGTGSGAALSAASKRDARNRSEAAALAGAIKAAVGRSDAAESLATEVERTVTLGPETAAERRSERVGIAATTLAKFKAEAVSALRQAYTVLKAGAE